MDGMIDSLMGIFEIPCPFDLCSENVHPALGVKGELWPELGVGPGRGAGVPDGGRGSSPQTRAPAGPGGMGSCLDSAPGCRCCVTDLRAPQPKSSCHVMSDSFATPWTVAHQAPLSMGFPR